MNTKAINAMIQTHKLSCITRRKGNFVCSCGRDQAESELASLKKELDSLRSIIEETIEALEEHNLTRTLQAIKSDYEDAKKGIYKGKGI